MNNFFITEVLSIIAFDKETKETLWEIKGEQKRKHKKKRINKKWLKKYGRHPVDCTFN